MKSSQLLPWYAASVLAKDFAIFDLPSTGECRSSSLLGGIFKAPECSGKDLTTEVYGGQVSLSVPGEWPISSPCARNGTHEFCIYASSRFAAGRGIAVFTSPERAEQLANSPAFTDPAVTGAIPELNAEESPKWRVEAMPGKGMGLIATKNFRVGDHIMSATPSVMIDYNVFYSLSDNQIAAMQGDGIAYLPPRHRAIFMNLSTHDAAENYVVQVAKVIQTNAFDLEESGVISKREGETESWYTVFPEISRLNHDCRPNADYHFDSATLAQHILAVKPIMAGEEITVSYIDPVLPRDIRLSTLDRSWHFPCDCSLCNQNPDQTAASDARIFQILELRKQLRDYSTSSQATPAMGELLVSLFEQEGLYGSIFEAYTYTAIEYNGAGEPWLATKYARLAIKHGLASSGPKDPDVIEMKELARDPWDHWSWMLRTKKRMNWGSNIDE